jgi:hypothetical protein
VNVSEGADELGVASADLRRLLWARPHLVDAAAQMEERRLDLAEKNIYEALRSEDSRRRDAASMFTIRNSAKAKRRGWLTSAGSVDVNINSNLPPREMIFSWREPQPSTVGLTALEREELQRKAAERRVWNGGERGDDGGKLIEHEPAKDEPASE